MDPRNPADNPLRPESGRWCGYYEQCGDHYAQNQTMEFADGLVRGHGEDDIGSFRIEGIYRCEAGELRIGWIKTYDGGHSVLYLGQRRGDWIEGGWSLRRETRGSMDGGFGFAPERLFSPEAQDDE